MQERFSICIFSHQKITCFKLVGFHFVRSFIDSEVEFTHESTALLKLLEPFEEFQTFLNLDWSIGMSD